MIKTFEKTSYVNEIVCDICGKGAYKPMRTFTESISFQDVMSFGWIHKKYVWDVHEECLVRMLRKHVIPGNIEKQS